MIPDTVIEKAKSERRELQREVRERMSGYIMAALGLVAGLAWNDAIKSAIEAVFPAAGSGIAAKFVYAAVITVAIVVAAYYVSKLFSKSDTSAKS